MRAVRLLFPLRQVAASPFPPVAFFSSSSLLNTTSTNCVAATDANGGGSVPRNRPKFKWNSANFVGTVEEPLKVKTRNGETVLAWTFLRAKVSPDSNSSFKIMLKLWKEMAESYLERLKPNDFIHVAGTLESYKADKYGKSYLTYELTVSELNHIARKDQVSKCQNSVGMQHEEGYPHEDKYRKRLHLWQVFFSSPYEWWDNRNQKSNPKHPDFKHKSTGEALWLQATDPPWIRKQLELLDTKMVEKDQDDHFGSDSSMSKWLCS